MVSWGILGTAQIALDKVAPAILNTLDARLVAVASRSKEKAATWLKKLSEKSGQAMAEVKVYDTYEALLADPEIDVIYIPLPNSLHCEWTVKAAKAKKHVLCEKPLASNSKEARLMIDTCKAEGVLLMEGFMYHFSPQYDRVREMVAAGRIGEPKLIRAAFTYILGNLQDIRYNKGLAGGSLMDVGCYCIHAVRTLFGQEPISAAAVEQHDQYIDTSYFAILNFPEGRTALIDAGFATTARQSIEIAGTNGVLIIDQPFISDVKPTRLITGPTLGYTEPEDFATESLPTASTYELEIAAFTKAVANGSPLPVDPEDAYRNMRVIDAVREAALTGKTVKLD